MVGGGNTAVEEALYLTHHASKVTLVHRRDSFRAEKILQDRLFKNPKVTVLWDNTLQEILGEAKPAPLVQGVRVKNVKTGIEKELATDGVFIAIGHSPNTELFKGKLAMDSEGYLITKPDSTATDVEGRLRRGRRAGQDLPSGRHGGRHRLHGGARGGEMAGAPRSAPRASRGVSGGADRRLAHSAKAP